MTFPILRIGFQNYFQYHVINLPIPFLKKPPILAKKSIGRIEKVIHAKLECEIVNNQEDQNAQLDDGKRNG